jgi:metal-responsive CopG/Arc/MetJ family transcriptional regulator
MKIQIDVPDEFFTELVIDAMKAEATAVGRSNIIRDAVMEELKSNSKALKNAIKKGMRDAVVNSNLMEELGEQAIREKFRTK